MKRLKKIAYNEKFNLCVDLHETDYDRGVKSINDFEIFLKDNYFTFTCSKPVKGRHRFTIEVDACDIGMVVIKLDNL